MRDRGPTPPPKEESGSLPPLSARDRWLSWCTFDLLEICATDARVAMRAHYAAIGRVTAQAAREHYGREALTAGECTSFPLVDLTPADVAQVAIVAARRRAARDLLARMSFEADGVERHEDALVRWATMQPGILARLGAAGFLRFDPPDAPARPVNPRCDRMASEPREKENAFDGVAP